MVSSKTTGMSPEEMRARADLCKRMAISFGPTNSEMMREVADLWHRLAADAEARAANPLRPLGASGRSPTKRFVEGQAAMPSSWKSPRMAAWMAW